MASSYSVRKACCTITFQPPSSNGSRDCAVAFCAPISHEEATMFARS